MKKPVFLLLALAFLSLQLSGQENTRAIEFPDLPDYQTLACDFHMHTVLSDGHVWPSIRVQEALKDGLDAISITDHIEYQPHQKDIPHTDRNRSYELALKAARGSDLIIIHGAEITRSMPPGHLNALFVQDVNQLMDPDVMVVLREAKEQGAFVFWNHPHWTAQQKDGVAGLKDMHLEMLQEGLFQGIEIYNEYIYSDEALEIALENKLTLLGTSDIHGLIDWAYPPSENLHRPVTLVFAREKSAESIKEALQERRTAVWFDNSLVGAARFLIPLVEHALEVSRKEKNLVQSISVHNHSDADYVLENRSAYRMHNQPKVFILKAHQSTELQVKTLEELDSFELEFRVLNAFTATDKHPEIKLVVK